MFNEPYFAITGEFAFSGPHHSLLALPEDTIHLRTAEQWLGLFDMVEHLAIKYPEKTGYFSINGGQVYAVGLHETPETAKAVSEQIQSLLVADMAKKTEHLNEGLGVPLFTNDLPAGRIFSVKEIPSWREQLSVLLTRSIDATSHTAVEAGTEPA